jgi:hypothetical protein
VSDESAVARAVMEMRKYDPDFSLWNLESEANVIYKNDKKNIDNKQ